MNTYKIGRTKISEKEFYDDVKILEEISGRPLDRSVIGDGVLSVEEIVHILDRDGSGTLLDEDFYNNPQIIRRPDLLSKLDDFKAKIYCGGKKCKSSDPNPALFPINTEIWNEGFLFIKQIFEEVAEARKNGGKISLSKLDNSTYFKMMKDILKSLFEEFKLDPSELEHYQNFSQYLAANGIRFHDRIHSLRTALTLIHNRKFLHSKEDPRPIALLLYNVDDWNDAFSGVPVIDTFVDSRKFRVLYYEIGSDHEMKDIMAQVTKETGNKIHTLVLAGHGTKTSLHLGPGNQEDKDLDIGDFDDGQLDSLSQQIEKNGQVLFYACSTGQGNIEEDKNLANKISSLIPGRQIYSSQDASNITSLSIDDNLSLHIVWNTLTPYNPLLVSDIKLAHPINTGPAHEISIPQFMERMESKLKDKTVGYAMVVIRPDGNPYFSAGGMTRNSPDQLPRPMSFVERLNVASITKTITAVAVLQLLARRRLTLDSAVYPYLPKDWTLGPNVKTITFRDLLTHQSGIVSGEDNTDINSLRATLAAGVELKNKGNFKYQNRNFALFRVIIPYLNGFRPGPKTDLDQATSQAYLNYLNRNIFRPSGISLVDANPAGDDLTTLSSPLPAGKTPDTTFGNWTKIGDTTELQLSAMDLAKFLYFLRNTNILLSPTQNSQMANFELGWEKTQVKNGYCFYKEGYFPTGNPATTPLAERAESNSLIVSFSDGMSVALIVNSAFRDSPHTPPDFLTTVKEAYNEAYREQVPLEDGIYFAFGVGWNYHSMTIENHAIHGSGPQLGLGLGYLWPVKPTPTYWVAGGGLSVDLGSADAGKQRGKDGKEYGEGYGVYDFGLMGLIGTLANTGFNIQPGLGWRYARGGIEGGETLKKSAFWFGGDAGISLAGGFGSFNIRTRFLPDGGYTLGGVLNFNFPTAIRYEHARHALDVYRE